ncbi:hypothetical protein AAE478_004172, partial [Parahypoxylon ruwenzoriense]
MEMLLWRAAQLRRLGGYRNGQSNNILSNLCLKVNEGTMALRTSVHRDRGLRRAAWEVVGQKFETVLRMLAPDSRGLNPRCASRRVGNEQTQADAM